MKIQLEQLRSQMSGGNKERSGEATAAEQKISTVEASDYGTYSADVDTDPKKEYYKVTPDTMSLAPSALGDDYLPDYYLDD